MGTLKSDGNSLADHMLEPAVCDWHDCSVTVVVGGCCRNVVVGGWGKVLNRPRHDVARHCKRVDHPESGSIPKYLEETAMAWIEI